MHGKISAKNNSTSKINIGKKKAQKNQQNYTEQLKQNNNSNKKLPFIKKYKILILTPML